LVIVAIEEGGVGQKKDGDVEHAHSIKRRGSKIGYFESAERF